MVEVLVLRNGLVTLAEEEGRVRALASEHTKAF